MAYDASPRIYVDLEYVTDTRIRAAVKLHNIPAAVTAGGFHIHIDDGLKAVLNKLGRVNITDPTALFNGIIGIPNQNSNDIFVMFASTHYNTVGDTLFCFNLDKTPSYSSTNSDVSVYLAPSDFISAYDGSQDVSLYAEDVETQSIAMANEFMRGDADCSMAVNAIDASAVLGALRQNNGQPIYVDDIADNYTSYFPNATAPAAADANNDGVIDMDDVHLIMDCYSALSTGTTPDGIAGTRSIYEYYEF